MKKIPVLSAFFCTLILFSCKKSTTETVFNSTNVSVYNGNVSTTLQTDQAGNPSELAISLDANVLNSLPTGANARDTFFVITLNPKALDVTPFNHIELDWNPHGHPPVGVYDLPHFDFHFYMVPFSDVQAAVDPTKMETLPSLDYLPANYFPGPSVPQMGKHWIDKNAPELNGGAFNQTFIYGTYNGNVTFYEPMVTKAYLETTTSFQRSIPQPSKVNKSGYYPTEFIVRKVNNVTQVVLDKFVYRQAS